MKTPVHLILAMIEPYYDNEDETNTYDLGVQYMSKDMVTFPRVEMNPGDGVDLEGFKSYSTMKGLVPEGFTGGSFTWTAPRKLDDEELYSENDEEEPEEAYTQHK